MHGRTRLAAALASCLLLAAPAARAGQPAIARADKAIHSGNIVPERDLQPLLDALQRSRVVDDRRELVGKIEDLASRDAQTPNVVKSWLLEHAPPVLLEVARTGNDAFLQGDAITALREMGASRALLEQAAEIAENDPNEFVQSRGEILRNYIRSMPAEDAAAKIAPADDARAREAIAYLDKRAIGVSMASLREAARRADVDSVRALLAAGVPADAGATTYEDSPLGKAVSYGCTSQGEDTDWLVETIQVLIQAGADLRRVDDNSNTVLIQAAHWCGARVVALLAGTKGIDINHKNGSGLSAFGLAFVSDKLDAAAALLAKGARVGAEEKAMLVHSANTPRAKDLLAKATAPRK